jgi:hypothetical protein
MKKIFFICCVVYSLFTSSINAQEDEFSFKYSSYFGLIPISLNTTENVSEVGSHTLYRKVEDKSMVISCIINFGANIPLYKTKNWSLGVNPNVGIGGQMDIIQYGALPALCFDFPQYIYYKNYKNSFTYSFLLGYKFSFMGYLPYQVPMAGFEFSSGGYYIGLYASLKKYQYYTLYTNGDIEPSLGILDFGLAFGF